ncbi:MAG: hypothetical protein JWM64_824, partial [Frankiales bacterium]|nr:hypothetical protein [Frankiales bacterium]
AAAAAGLPPGAAAPADVPEKGRGWDKDFVYIGVATQKDVAAAAKGVGAKGLDAGDQEAQALSVAAYFNKQGGVFGRKVKIVFKDQSTVATAGDPNTAGASACTYFTQDHPVIALLNPVTLMDVPSFRACLSKAKVPLFSASVAAVDDKVGADLAPYFYQSVAPSWNALAPVLVARLKAQGWFGGWNARTGAAAPGKAKVGVLIDTTPVGKRVATVITKALQAAGAGAPVVYAASGSDYSGAVLQFSGNGVTHVISADSSLVNFQTSASSQGYRPRYGIHTYNAPQTFLEGNSPAGQNNGALGVGWSPSFDVSDTNDTGDIGPAEKLCKEIYAAGKQSFQGKRLAEAVAFAFCDGIRLIVGGAAAGGGFTGTQVYDGVQRTAGKFSSAFSFGSGLGPKTLFVPGAVRDLVWGDACRCTKYASPTVHPLTR